MASDGLVETMEGVVERMRSIHAEFERCRLILHDENAAPEDVFAARWLCARFKWGSRKLCGSQQR